MARARLRVPEYRDVLPLLCLPRALSLREHAGMNLGVLVSSDILPGKPVMVTCDQPVASVAPIMRVVHTSSGTTRRNRSFLTSGMHTNVLSR